MAQVLSLIDDDTLRARRDRALVALAFREGFHVRDLPDLRIQDLRRDRLSAATRRDVASWLDSARLTGGRVLRPVNRWGRVAGAQMTRRSIAGRLQERAAEAGLWLVPWVRTPWTVVDLMLAAVETTPEDVVYDLGCGDGRIVIRAAQRFGASGVGIDLDPSRLDAARALARRAGVERRVRFIRGDLFDADLRRATVITLFLIYPANLALAPILRRGLRPNVRVVSHNFHMGDWRPWRIVPVDRKHRLYCWRIPRRRKPGGRTTK